MRSVSQATMNQGAGSPASSILADTLTYLNLQDIILDANIQVSIGSRQPLFAPLVAQNLLDCRGSEMDSALRQLLVRGTTLQMYNRQHDLTHELSYSLTSDQFYSPDNTTRACSGCPRYAHPVLLESDATTVGDRAYLGKAEQVGMTNPGIGSNALQPQVAFCFLVRLASEGCSAVIVIERQRVYAQSSFSEADSMLADRFNESDFYLGAQSQRTLFWTILTGGERAIVHASMLSQCSMLGEPGMFSSPAIDDDVLVLHLADGSVAIISVNRVPRHAVVRIEHLTLAQGGAPGDVFTNSTAENELFQASSIRQLSREEGKAPVSPPRCRSAENEHSDLNYSGRRNYSLPNNSDLLAPVMSTMGKTRLVLQYNYSGMLDESDDPGSDAVSNASLFQTSWRALKKKIEHFILVIDKERLNSDDPLMAAMSSTYLSAVSEDTDIITVVPHNFANWINQAKCQSPIRRESPVGVQSGQPIIMQTEENVSSIAMLRDTFLLAGLVDGRVSVFRLADGAHSHTFTYHERRVTVVRPLCGSSSIAHHSSGPSGGAITLGRSSRRSASRSTCFITGSSDTTISIFCIDDMTQLKSLRVHFAPIVDICATNFMTHGVIISCDATGEVVVSMFNTDDLQSSVATIWTSNIPNIAGLHMSFDGSWLLCTRRQAPPQAMPVGEWVRHGVAQFHIKPISVIHISHCERYLLTGGEDGVIFVWDLCMQVKHLLSFRKHAVGSTIASISTSSDASKVISSDSLKFVQLWCRATGSVIRTMSRSGECICKFLPGDYAVVRSSRDFKIFSPDDRLVMRSPELGAGVEFQTGHQDPIDFYVALSEDYDDVFKPQEGPPVSSMKRRPNSSSSSSSDELSLVTGLGITQEVENETSNGVDDVEADQNDPHSPVAALIKSGASVAPKSSSYNATAIDTEDSLTFRAELAYRVFVGVVNNRLGRHCVEIYCLNDISRPKFVLQSGELDDELESDDELVEHEDNISAFSFLQPRPQRDKGLISPPLSRSPSILPEDHRPPEPPSLFLAATGGDDLIVILWNWWRQEPLVKLQHTNFVTAVSFMYPTMSAAFGAGETAYSQDDLEFMRANDPSFQYAYEGPLALLLTAQEPDSQNDTTLRVFEIREKANSLQSRYLLARRCEKMPTRAFNLTKPVVSQAGEASRHGHGTGALTIRQSDGLVCTGTGGINDIVFWRWMCTNGIQPSPSSPTNQSMSSALNGAADDSDSEKGDNELQNVLNIDMRLRPLRKVTSRI